VTADVKKITEFSGMNKKQIIFNKSSNIFLNTGIVALYYYLQKHKESRNLHYAFDFKLTEEELTVESDELFTLLEDVYYLMGKEIYDTSGKNAVEKADKYFFVKEPFKAEAFAKMKTYGLGALITNDAQAVASKKGKKIKFEKLISEDRDFAIKIAEFLNLKGKKLKFYSFNERGELEENPIISGKKRVENKGGESEIFIDAPYTKTTNLPIGMKFLEPGEEICYLTGEKYKELVDTQNTTPFSNFQNFSSFLNTFDKKISWKAMYLSRFSPKLSFHQYVNGLESLVVYLYNSNNLLNLEKIYRQNNIQKDTIQLIEGNYMSNFELAKFNDKWKEFYIGQHDNLFMLLYTFYRRVLKSQITNFENKSAEVNPFEDSDFKHIPVSLVYFRANKFASTMRPNAYEELNNFKFLVRMIYYFEKKGVEFSAIFRGLLLLKPSFRSKKNSIQLERQFRDKVLGKLIRTKPIIQEIERLFFDCFRYTMTNENIGFRNYKQLLLLLNLYEPIVKYGGNNHMNPELQQRAINLGKSIGQGILNHDASQSKTVNAKQGRSYIIAIRKSRTLTQFLDELTRIQFKFGNSISNDILQEIKQENFIYIKQFATISALNQLNSALQSSDKNQNYEKE
jgi:hypothetical protein